MAPGIIHPAMSRKRRTNLRVCRSPFEFRAAIVWRPEQLAANMIFHHAVSIMPRRPSIYGAPRKRMMVFGREFSPPAPIAHAAPIGTVTSAPTSSRAPECIARILFKSQTLETDARRNGSGDIRSRFISRVKSLDSQFLQGNVMWAAEGGDRADEA